MYDRDMLCALHAGDETRLLNVSAEELKLLMETMAKETLSSYQVLAYLELSKKLHAVLHSFSSNQFVGS